jgi:hypothetical protein
MDPREEYYRGIAIKFKTNRNLFTHQDCEFMRNRHNFTIQEFHRINRHDKLTCELFNFINQNNIRNTDDQKTLYQDDLEYLQEHCDNLDYLDNFNITATNAVLVFSKVLKASTLGRLKNHESIISNETVKQAFDNRVIELMRTDSEGVRRHIQIAVSDTTLIGMSHRYNLFREEKQFEMKRQEPIVENLEQFVRTKLMSIGVDSAKASECSSEIATHVKRQIEISESIHGQNSEINERIKEILEFAKFFKNKLWWLWPFSK